MTSDILNNFDKPRYKTTDIDTTKQRRNKFPPGKLSCNTQIGAITILKITMSFR